MPKHGAKSTEYVEKAVHEYEAPPQGVNHLADKRGELRSSRKRAIAMGLSEARAHGAKVPKQQE